MVVRRFTGSSRPGSRRARQHVPIRAFCGIAPADLADTVNLLFGASRPASSYFPAVYLQSLPSTLLQAALSASLIFDTEAVAYLLAASTGELVTYFGEHFIERSQ